MKRLIAKRDQAAKTRETVLAQRKAITDLAESEAREDLSIEEDAEFRKLTESAKDLYEGNAERGIIGIKAMDERIAEMAEEAKRDAEISEGAAAVRRAQARAQIVAESRTYEKGNGQSYLRDLVRSNPAFGLAGADEARTRLERHGVEVRTDKEYRDLNRTDTTGGYAVPPLWMMQGYLDLARAGRATANIVSNFDLPSGTDSINIPKMATGTAVAVQTADNAAVSETDLADTVVTAGVKTIAGQQDLAIQLIDQSPISFDEVVFRDLVADYATKLDLQVLNGSNGSGQVKGLLGATGINAITYTDTSPTVAELYPKLADAVQQVHTGRFMSPTVIVMHPRRWAWILSALDSQNRPLVVPNGPGQNQIGTLSAVASQQVVGQIHGLPVVTDPNVPTNLGAGTNEDRIIVMKADDLYLWESSIRTRVLPEVGSGNLTVRLQVYGYLAFTAERYPASISVISGTGLVTPTF